MKHTIFSLILLFISTSIFAARKEILLNENWMFRFSHQVQLPGTVAMPFPANRITIVEWATIPKRCL